MTNQHLEPLAVEEDDLDPIEFPAEMVRRLAPVFETSTTGMARILGMSPQRVWRRIHQHKKLPPEYQRQMMGAIRVYVAALKMYGFHTPQGRREARSWMNEWLRTPALAFTWKRPIDLLKNPRDSAEITTLLRRFRYGVYT